MNKPYHIYLITNLVNSKRYIGQTVDPHARWRQHKAQARKEEPSMVINRAMKKYGIENFSFEVIACCLGQEAANDTETFFVQEYQSHISTRKGYNVSNGGSTAPKTDEWKKHLSLKLKGRRLSPATEFKPGHKLKPESLAKLAASNTGKCPGNLYYFTAEQEAAMIEAYQGGSTLRVIGNTFNVTKKVVKRILEKNGIRIRTSYEANIGRKQSPEAIANSARAHTGLKYKKRIDIGRKRSPEAIANSAKGHTGLKYKRRVS